MRRAERNLALAPGGRWKRGVFLPACLSALAALVPAISALADGSLPPLPYRYLHPPAALAGENQTPGPASRLFARSRLRDGWSLFTPDGQAGIAGGGGSLVLSPQASGAVIALRPVESPPGVPGGMVVDGNAYAVSAAERPGGGTPAPARRLTLVMKWPHIPTGIDSYRGGRWRTVCTTDSAVLTGSTISCSVTTFGLFAAVTPASSSGTGMPPTPIVSTPFSWLNRYIPLLAAILLIVAAVIAGYFVSRPDRERG